MKKWLNEGHHQDYCSASEHAIAQAAQWGADRELEACIELLDINGCPGRWIDMLRAVLAHWGTSNLAEVRSSLEDHQPLVEDDVDLFLEQ